MKRMEGSEGVEGVEMEENEAEQQLCELFEAALGIREPWYVKEVVLSAEEKRIEINIDFRKGTAFAYKDEEVEGSYKAHNTVIKKLRHLNFFEYECFLCVRTPVIRPKPGKTRTIKTPWEGLSKGLTLLYEAFVLRLGKHMSVHAAHRLTGLSDRKIWTLLDRYVEKAREKADLSNVTRIGMDEKSAKKGHRYITVFVDLDARKAIYVAEGRGSEAVAEFRKELERRNGDPSRIEHVSCDMSKAYIKGVQENFHNAKITFDRFHIVKIINEAVDETRRRERKERPDLLKNTRYLFLKNDESLTEAQKSRLDVLSMRKWNLKSIRALHIRRNFQEIYKNASSREEFERLLEAWHGWASKSRLEPMKAAARTIKRHWEGIVNWYDSRINNGILEGMNSLIQAAKARARGYRRFRYLKIIVYLVVGKLDFKTLNACYEPL